MSPFFNVNRWVAKIGFKMNAKGIRDRAWFYSSVMDETKNAPQEVVADFVLKDREWKKIREEWPTLRPALEQIDPESDWSKPVWFDRAILSMPLEDADEIKKAVKADADYLVQDRIAELKQISSWGGNQDQIVTYLRSAGLLPKGIILPTRHPSIWDAVKEYLEAQRKRTTMKIGDVISVNSYNTKRNNLLICLGMSIAEKPEVQTKIIDLNKPLLTLGNDDLKKLAEYWFTLPGDVKSRRTVRNYISEFKAFLDWCDYQDDFGFSKPKGIKKILFVADSDETTVTKTDFPLLKRILSNAAERTRMYAAFGLFCGFIQSDICTIEELEVEYRDGEMFTTGYRKKEDAERKQKSKLKVTHWIPPELARVIEKNKAQKNEFGLYFLNRYNRPMFRTKMHGSKSNAVTKAWEKVSTDAAGSSMLNFRQLRKWGWNEIQKYGDDKVCRGETLARRWAGQQGGGIGNKYRFEDYEPVIAAQREWWKVLKKEISFFAKEKV